MLFRACNQGRGNLSAHIWAERPSDKPLLPLALPLLIGCSMIIAEILIGRGRCCAAAAYGPVACSALSLWHFPIAEQIRFAPAFAFARPSAGSADNRMRAIAEENMMTCHSLANPSANCSYVSPLGPSSCALHSACLISSNASEDRPCLCRLRNWQSSLTASALNSFHAISSRPSSRP